MLEEISTAGLMLQMLNLMKQQQLTNVQEQQGQLQEFGINPLLGQISEMKDYLGKLDAQSKAAEGELNAVLKAKKLQERQLNETQRAYEEKQQELLDIQVQAQQAKQRGYVVNIPQAQDVQTGTEDYGGVPQKRNAHGKFA